MLTIYSSYSGILTSTYFIPTEAFGGSDDRATTDGFGLNRKEDYYCNLALLLALRMYKRASNRWAGIRLGITCINLGEFGLRYVSLSWLGYHCWDVIAGILLLGHY
jgi:hypothetical protein